jgi:hypothetical protein
MTTAFVTLANEQGDAEFYSSFFRIKYDHTKADGSFDTSRSSTLYQEIPYTRQGESLKVQEYRFLNKRRVKSGEPVEIRISEWDSRRFSPAGDQIRFDSASNRLDFRNRPTPLSGEWQSIETDLLEQIQIDPGPYPGEHCIELSEWESVLEESKSRLAKKEPTAPLNDTIENLRQDIQWLRSLSLEKKYLLNVDGRRSVENGGPLLSLNQRRSNAKYELLTKLSKSERFQGNDGEDRANRLIVALTLYGEFRGQTSSASGPAYLFWTYASLKRRAGQTLFGAEKKSALVRQQIVLEKWTANGRQIDSLGNWLKDSPAEAALTPWQYSTWNSNDSNLTQILTGSPQPGGTLAMEKIINFIQEMENGDWSIQSPASDTPEFSIWEKRYPGWNMDSYHSMEEDPVGFIRQRLPPIINSGSQQIVNISPNDTRFRAGYYVTREQWLERNRERP